mmetsp:Transcript_5461/g.9243  ORF Transcript_5461/g.9243 Transcript_5461/m.9243 type:complete len:88 (-) Transcript_5461:778-1041(-)
MLSRGLKPFAAARKSLNHPCLTRMIATNTTALTRAQILIETEELQALLDQSQKVKLVNSTANFPGKKEDHFQRHLEERITLDTVFYD